jgi:O-antigen ligase
LQTWLIGSFLFFNVFSLIVAKNIDWSERKLLFLFSIFPIYFVASQLISSRERMLKLIRAIVFSTVVVALIGIIQFLLQFMVGLEATYAFWAKFVTAPFLGNTFGAAVLKNPSWLVNISGQTYLRATSLFPDPHMFSFYLGLVMPLAFGLIIENKRKIKKWLAVLAFGVIFLADILSFSRGGYLGLFAGLIFVLLASWQRINKKYKVAISVFLCASVLVMLVPSPVSQRFVSSFDFKEGSNLGRIAMWQKATSVIADHPFLGVGIGNYPLEVSPTATYRDPIYAHNTYLDIAVETGILNALFFIGLLFITVLNFWKKSRQENIFFFAVISLVIFSAHSLVETAIYSPVVLTLFLIVLSFDNLSSVETPRRGVSTGATK